MRTNQMIMTDSVKFDTSTEKAAFYIQAALQAEVELRRHVFLMSSDLQNIIMQIAEFFTQQTTKYGILLCGGVGNGKSSMMYALSNLIPRLYTSVNGHISSNNCGIKSYSAKHINSVVAENYKRIDEYNNALMLGIDDLGEEEVVVMNYGNRMTPVVDLLSYRYLRRLFTIITTNLTPAQIRQVYGDRIADRFNEMMLIIPYKHPSFRTPASSNKTPS